MRKTNFFVIACFTIFALTIVFLFLPNSKVPLLSDDYVSILWQWKSADPFSSVAWRPFYSLIFVVFYKLFGINPLPYHLFSIIIHSVNVLLVGIFTLRFLRRREVALIAMILFLLYSKSSQIIYWFSGLADGLMLMFVLASLICYLVFLETKRKSFFFLTLIFAIFSVLAKEAGFFIFPLFFLLRFTNLGEGDDELIIAAKRALKDTYLWVLWSIGFLYALFMLFVKLGRLSSSLGYHPLGAVLVVKNFLWGLLALVFYEGFRPFGFKQDFFTHTIFIPVILMGGLFFFWFVNKKREKRAVIFFTLWIFLALVPTSILGGYGLMERYLYVPGVGFVILLSVFFVYLLESRLRLVQAVGGVLLLLWITVSVGNLYSRLAQWQEAGRVVEKLESFYRSLDQTLIRPVDILTLDFPYSLSNGQVYILNNGADLLGKIILGKKVLKYSDYHTGYSLSLKSQECLLSNNNNDGDTILIYWEAGKQTVKSKKIDPDKCLKV